MHLRKLVHRAGAFALAMVAGLVAWSPRAEAVLVGVDSATDNLVSIDSITGEVSVIGSLGAGNPDIRSLARVGDALYGVDVRRDTLVSIDPLTGAATDVGGGLEAAGGAFGFVGGLAYDAVAEVLYGVDEDTLTNQLVSIDIATGIATEIGALGPYPDVRSLAFNDGTLYGVDLLADTLLSIDPLSGVATAIGTLDFNAVALESLTFFDNFLYGIDASSDNLYRIDPLTAEGTVVTTLTTPVVGWNPFIRGLVGPVETAGGGQPPASVPAPGPLPLLAVGLSWVALRRRWTRPR